jgi:hypothetical protein
MADINLKDEKRISVNGEYDLVTTHPNNEPIYRSNGHELELNEINSDYIATNESEVIVNVSDIDIEIDFVLIDAGYIFEKGQFSSATNGYLRCFININNLVVQLRDKGSFYAQFSTPISEGVNYNLVINNRAVILNGSTIGTFNEAQLNIDGTIGFGAAGIAGGSPSQFASASFSSIKYQGESFNPTNINSNAQIEGSNGTIAQVNSSAADPINYILGTVFQKSGFALVGNGTTQKIVSPLGSEIILTSTPLEGGFDLDGKTYNLKEGLGNVIKSTDGTTESDIVGFIGTSLNFGGWQKGDNINGWNPYTL